MPKIIEKERREELKSRILRMLSVDGRMSVGNMAKCLKITKPSAYHLFLEVVKEYDLHFVPEINIEEMWRYEFLKLSRMQTKREILEETINKLPDVGFHEYIVLFKFLNKEPPESRVLSALGDSYIPQYVGKLKGEYSFIMYAVARSYQEMNAYIIDFSKKFREPLVSELNKIKRHFGYFPLRSELLRNFNISETYLALLLGLSEDGRRGFRSIAQSGRRDPAIIQYAMDRLRRTEILHRISYYEGRPRNVVNALILMKVTNYDKFLRRRNRWFLQMVNDYNGRHNEYICAYDISNPQGAVVIGCFKDSDSAERFFEDLKRNTSGVELKYITLTKTLLGHLGIRDFDMRYSSHYQYLERQKLVPQFYRKGGKYIATETEPDEEEVEVEGSEPAEELES